MPEPSPNTLCIYVTGLPASGKTTLARYLAEETELPLLDKDDFLESLFDEKGVGDSGWRQQLSREADALFRRSAEKLDQVILVSHWRPYDLNLTYGTPSDWLSSHYAQLIEVSCECPIDEASRRFISRNRHPGHVDHQRSQQDIRQWFADYSQYLPIGIGSIVKVNSNAANWKDEALSGIKCLAEDLF